jgi:GNAT superfamily N-acetyltransferase
LEENRLFHVGMIFPVMRGTADIIYAGNDGVFLREMESGAYMLSVKCAEKGKELLDAVGQQKLFCLFQESMADYMMGKHGYYKRLTCLQAVYEGNEPILMAGALDIRQLGISDADCVFEHYHDYFDYDYIKHRLERGAIYGGFLDGELCGFVGTHEEGGIGILEVLGKYRKRGFGAELLSFITNQILRSKQIPFSQIVSGNEGSLRLHERLGFTISKEKLYWLLRGT